MASQVKAYQYETKSGKKWAYRFEIASVDGVRQWMTKRGFNTKSDALKSGREAQSTYDNHGFVVKPSELSYSDFLDVWLSSLRGCIKETTYKNYEKKIRLYIKPYIGSYKLRSLSKNDVVTLIQNLSRSGRKNSGNGLATNTLSVVRGIVTKSLDYAVENKYILSNPIVGRLVIPKHDDISSVFQKEKPHVYIQKERIDDIFKRFPYGSSDHIPLVLGYKCGLRIGEAFAVCWEDIDFEKSTLTVNRQIQWHNGDMNFWYFTPPKYNSFRTISIDSSTAELLRRALEQTKKDEEYCGECYARYYVNKSGMILPEQADGFSEIHLINVRHDGTMISPRTMQHTSYIIHTKLNFPEFDFHSLRHTHATLLVENGAPPMYVQHRLGHKNLNVTMKYYLHFTNSIDEHGKSIVESYFGDDDKKFNISE